MGKKSHDARACFKVEQFCQSTEINCFWPLVKCRLQAEKPGEEGGEQDRSKEPEHEVGEREIICQQLHWQRNSIAKITGKQKPFDLIKKKNQKVILLYSDIFRPEFPNLSSLVAQTGRRGERWDGFVQW